MTKDQSGFTLIELMIVVAIIGILAAIAIPMYQRYTIRSQITEGINLSAAAKHSVADYYMNTGNWPTDNNEAGLPAAASIVGEYTSQVSVAGNVISVQYGNSAHANISGSTVTLTGSGNTGSVSWVCDGSASIDVGNLPRACR